ncbi:MAG: hypothetical protein ACOC9Y_10365 [Chloroflexota bacterium]
MNALNRIMKNIRSSSIGRGFGPESFYGSISQKNPVGNLHINESRKDYERIRSGREHMGMF